MAGGIALRAVAMRTLGRDFVSAPQPSAHLERGGVFAWLRHPSESGLLAFMLGAAVASGSLVAFALLSPMTLLALARLDAEERALREMHGDAYIRYSQRVPALLPITRR